jgi:RNA polymerase sigma-70 factor (ECF subfamily)
MSAVADASRPLFDCVLRAWREHEAELRGFLTRQTGDADAADDLLQDVFVKAMLQGQGFCVLDNARAWLFQVARHAIVDAARAARPRAELSDELPAAAPRRDAVDELDGCLARGLQTLDEADRDIAQACDLDGRTVRAYAQDRGLSLAAAKSRLLRARRRLRDALMVHCGVRFDAQGQVCCHVPTPRD